MNVCFLQIFQLSMFSQNVARKLLNLAGKNVFSSAFFKEKSQTKPEMLKIFSYTGGAD